MSAEHYDRQPPPGLHCGMLPAAVSLWAPPDARARVVQCSICGATRTFDRGAGEKLSSGYNAGSWGEWSASSSCCESAEKGGAG